MKKLPPWALIGGAVALGALVWFWKKRKEDQAKLEQAEGASEAPVVAGVEPEEYPYSIAGLSGGGVGGGAIGNASETNQQLRELFGESEKRRIESEVATVRRDTEQGEILAKLYERLKETTTQSAGSGTGTISQGSGGGAPSESRPGTTPAPPRPEDRCGQGTHAGFPNGTPPDCWRVSRTRTPGGCECHGHQNGHLECQRGRAPHCVW